MGKNDLEHALVDLDQAYKLNSTDRDTLLALGLAYYNKGDMQQAINNWERLVQLYPNDAPTLYNLGIAYYNKGDTATAVEILKKALDLCGSNTTLCTNTLQALQKLGKE
jgi:tetratricopeptide (TPR) repeat protein